MRISVIICTYGRANVLGDLLRSLNDQLYRDFETLIIDGNPEPSMARSVVTGFLRGAALSTQMRQMRLIESPKGLTRQRNVGLDAATGEVLCFLDDDVTLPSDFLLRVANILNRHDFQGVGGLTGYDSLNYPNPVTLRWRLRRALGVIPDLPPGGVDRLGRGIPLSFLQPFTGFKEVGLLHGFCMIYRRSALGSLRFDELIPTYAGEDRDFSMQVGWRSRLLICGDLRLEHHASPQGRDSEIDRNYQSAFGMGRRFAKYSRGGMDTVTLVTTFLADFAIDLLFLIRHPSRLQFRATLIRIKGFFAGLRSDISIKAPESRLAQIDAPERHADGVTSIH